MNQQCWIIAGAASAIAVQFAHLIAARGDQLILLGRDLEKLKALQNDLITRYHAEVDVVLFDAEKSVDHPVITTECIKLAKHPIHLLLAFGVMLPSPAVDHSHTDTVKAINTNFTGVVSTIYAFLPYFREQKQGHILILGSVAGDRGRPANFDYGAAKAGLVTFCEGLRSALHPDHVSVTLMKLGYIDTPMMVGKPGKFIAASPEACARACLKAAENKVSIKYFPWFWRWIMLIFKYMPTFLLRRLKV